VRLGEMCEYAYVLAQKRTAVCASLLHGDAQIIASIT
jgi:hypothetical protein